MKLSFIGEKGRTHALIRENRGRERMEEQKEYRHRDLSELESRKNQMEKEMQILRERVSELEKMEVKYLKDEECLHDLFEAGMIDDDGRMKINLN